MELDAQTDYKLFLHHHIKLIRKVTDVHGVVFCSTSSRMISKIPKGFTDSGHGQRCFNQNASGLV